jgi:hypothetical protein
MGRHIDHGGFPVGVAVGDPRFDRGTSARSRLLSDADTMIVHRLVSADPKPSLVNVSFATYTSRCN